VVRLGVITDDGREPEVRRGDAEVVMAAPTLMSSSRSSGSMVTSRRE
jgi:hypothetical protein